MALFTNVSKRLIHAPDGTMMVPGMACEIEGEAASNQGFQDLVDMGDIVSGEPPAPEEMAKMQEEREAARQEEATNPEVQAERQRQMSVQRTTTVTAAASPQPQPQPQQQPHLNPAPQPRREA